LRAMQVKKSARLFDALIGVESTRGGLSRRAAGGEPRDGPRLTAMRLCYRTKNDEGANIATAIISVTSRRVTMKARSLGLTNSRRRCPVAA
jgi:hypothetical protein